MTMNIATRRHATKKSPVLLHEPEGFFVTFDANGEDNSSSTSKHNNITQSASDRHVVVSIVKTRRSLLFFAVALVVFGIVVSTAIVWWDMRHHHLPRMRMPSNNSLYSGRRSRASSFQQEKIRSAARQHQQQEQEQQQQHKQHVLQDDFSKQRTSPPCDVAGYYDFVFPEHGCLDNERAGRVHCRFRNLQIDLTKIHAAKMGGESLASSMGQDESVELLSYEKGAFVVGHEAPLETTTTTTATARLMPLQQQQKKYWHYMNQVRDALEYKNETANTSGQIPIKCDQTWPGVTLFITRYEYVNLYHTMTDWWNTYFTMTAAAAGSAIQDGKPQKKVNIVFLDAHPEGNLDPVWTSLFGKVSFIRRLPGNHICFEEARFVPAGYSSPIYPKEGGRSACPPDPGYTKRFVNHVLNVYNLSHVHRIPGHVVVIERIPYTSHPRSKPSNTERLLSNLRHLAMELPRTIMAHLPRPKEHDNGGLQFMFSSSSSSSTTIPKVTVKVVTLVNDTMRDQIAAIRQADVLLANHGAGLTHLLFLDQGAHVIELSCNHDFFVQLAQWHSSGDSSSQRLQHYCQDFVDGGATISDQFWNNNVVSVIANRVLHLDNP